MITTTTFWVLAAIDAVLIVYTFWDRDNRVYGNIICSFISFILSGMLGLYITSGTVGDTFPVATQKIVNITGVNQTVNYTYTNQTVLMQVTALGYIFIFGSIVMLIVMILLIVDARAEVLGEREAEKEEGD